ncbi:MAG: PAS domain S-box protein [Rhizobiaceae bacterium]|nr:PAS domain S-box protein [Rhizobiaceae bacterium]
MEQANANGVRVGWNDSRNGESNRHSHRQAHASPLLALSGHARQLSAPLWTKFLRSEILLRRSIPVLIIALLVMVAGARTGSLLGSAQRLQDTAHQQISLIANHLSLRIETGKMSQSFVGGLQQQSGSALLEEAKAGLDLPSGPSVYLFNLQGELVAQSPHDPAFERVNLSRLAGGNQMITLSERHAGVRSILLDGEHAAYATLHPVRLNDEIAGHLMVSWLHEQLYVNWHQQVRLNITLFLAISSVLLVFLYAYFTQGARARESDNLFLETNARFDTALARGRCGLWDWDLSRGRIVWSRSMYQMLGMEPTDKFMGYGDLAHLLHADDQDMIALANSAFQSSQKQIDHRFRIMHSSGTWVWMRIRAELVRYKGADPHLIGIAVDISEQEALKQKSRDADIRLRDAIENISEAFVLWDSKKRLVMCNSKYQQLYELPASAVTNGNSHHEVMAQSRKPKVRHQIKTDRKSDKGVQTFEAQIEDGRWLQISERRTQDGGFVSVGTDITQIKRNQEKLVESERRQMATIVDLRKTQQELERQAQKLVEFADNLNEEKMRADAGNKAKSEFLANISHELRTPLNAIIGFSDIMRSNMFGPLGSNKYDEYADDIHDSGNFLLGVINDVLDMSKIEAGRFQLQPETVHLHELLDETLRIIKVQADEAGIKVGQKIPKALELVADRRAVKQILLNLLSNAVKFTPENGKIDVTAKALKHDVNIVIRDNGIGISPEALDRLGQPFEQVQDQFTKDHKGSGLGLAIARSLTALHGGTFKITSEPGKGTTVSVRLPFKCQQPKCISEDDAEAA